MSLKPIKTVGELIKALKAYNMDDKLDATWEGQIKDVYVYKDADGTVLIDADDCNYRVPFQDLKCIVCGSDARREFKDLGPVCYSHWPEGEREIIT